MGSEKRNYEDVRVTFWVVLPMPDQPGITSAQWAYRTGFKGPEAQRDFDHLLDGLQRSNLRLPLGKEPIPGSTSYLYTRGSERLAGVSDFVIRQAERALHGVPEVERSGILIIEYWVILV